MHPMLSIAIRAARKAGSLIIKYYEAFDIIKDNQKNHNYYMREIKKEAEDLITKVIRKYYPLHSIIEESQRDIYIKDKDIYWIIDSVDGIDNFVKHFPHFNISISVIIRGRTEVSVIYDPIRNEIFSASRGQGAKLNGYRLRVSSANNVESTILATSFAFNHDKNSIKYFELVKNIFLKKCSDIRLSGSYGLDLAYVAAGRLDGLFKISQKSLNFFSGGLLVRESGGLITDFNGNPHYLSSCNIVAGNPRIVQSILTTIRESF